MQSRMQNPAVVLPDAMQPIQELFKAVHAGGVDGQTLELVHLRVSQINGCSACVDGGAKTARKAGVSDERLATVAAWREAPYFTEEERAALALAEAATRLADRPDAVSDEVWDTAATYFDEKQLAAIVLMIGVTNLFNRLNATDPPDRRRVGMTARPGTCSLPGTPIAVPQRRINRLIPVEETRQEGHQRSAQGTAATDKTFDGFTRRGTRRDEGARPGAEGGRAPRLARDKADGESAVLAKIAEMPEPDRAMAERLHAVIKASAPDLAPKLWYGMPAYAKDGKVVCFFQSAAEVQDEVRDARLQRRGEPRRRRHVADRLRADGVDRRRRGKDRRAREESGELRPEGAAAQRGRIVQ